VQTEDPEVLNGRALFRILNRAARLRGCLRTTYAKRRDTFGFESTLSGLGYVGLLQGLKKSGYEVHFFYLWVPTVSLALDRVKARVLQGGHNVPDEVVRRRFARSPRNFLLRYRLLAEYWMFLNNEGTTPAIVAFQKKGSLRIMNRDLYENLVGQYGTP
jgi:predicted ABC-type ATPase